jgi:hypothetical protein
VRPCLKKSFTKKKTGGLMEWLKVKALISYPSMAKKKKKNLTIGLSCDSAIPLLNIHPKDCKSASNRDTCTPRLVVALLGVAKTWNQHKCPLTNDLIKKM